MGQKPRHSVVGASAPRGSHGPEITVLARALGLIRGWGPFPSSQVVGRMHLLKVIRLKSLFSFWLSAGGGPWPPEATLRPLSHGPLYLQASKGELFTQQMFFLLQISDFLFRRKLSAFRIV